LPDGDGCLFSTPSSEFRLLYGDFGQFLISHTIQGHFISAKR
jgi:hypothetical protein